ncbi:hypothetical protein [Fusobacterium mortiferum]|uniref:hypothetical protein n=1 Tax=Fusobacterium mortiferum TaxID=850 RepID=UPI0015899D44|nr:hypothetical protein [Fusobacterium mortiferum]
MEEIVKKLIKEVDSFEIKDENLEELKRDTLKELESKPSSNNQMLWLCIKCIAEYMENYVG